jgi:O-methyltransferase
MGNLTRGLFLDEEHHDVNLDEWPGDSEDLLATLREHRWRLTRIGGADTVRADGRDWPPTAETMIGQARLANVRDCAIDVVERDVPGDFIETGVWRGGVTILMRGVLAAYDDTQRRVFVADSFEGLPAPDADNFPADVGHDMSDVATLAVSAEQVRANFERYGLLDDQVIFLEGWFRDTLPTAPIEALSILRLDGDLYESTMDALNALYPKLSVGGYCIVDDYGSWEACKAAIDEFRDTHGIDDEINTVDWSGIYWQKSS